MWWIPAAFAAVPDLCDGIDNDGDGLVDEDAVSYRWHVDADGDGYGDANTPPVPDCAQPKGHVDVGGDCDDSDPMINPDTLEICNGFDDDCDGLPDSGLPFLALWVDGDNDGYGGVTGVQYNGCPASPSLGKPQGAYFVLQPDGSVELDESGLVENNLDCNDFNANISPVAQEVCDELDNDCNGIVDDAQNGGQVYFYDGDGDGFGEGQGVYGCDPPDYGSVTTGGDCDDYDPDIHPDAAEVCDDVDNDCDGTIDYEAEDAEIVYQDLDEDGFGNPATALRECDPGPAWSATVGGDCDDLDPDVGPCGEEGCGCDGTGSGGSVLVALGLLTLARRPRP